MTDRPNLRLVGQRKQLEPEEPLGALAIKSTVNLVVARAAIRTHRMALLLKARSAREARSEAHLHFEDQELQLAIGVLHGKQLAYRETARKLRGLDK